MIDVVVPGVGEDVMVGQHLHVHHRPHGRASVLTVHRAHPFHERAIQVLERLSKSTHHHLCPAVSGTYGKIPGIYVQAGDSKRLENLLRAVLMDIPIL